MHIKNESGSSLVEVIVAMVILSLIVVGLNAGVVSLIKSNQNSKELSAASSIGSQLFEELRRVDYDSLKWGVDTVRNKYIRNWHVTTDSAKAKIDVKVSWPYSDPCHLIAMSTLISKP